jgi:hypothetical protein
MLMYDFEFCDFQFYVSRRIYWKKNQVSLAHYLIPFRERAWLNGQRTGLMILESWVRTPQQAH